MTQGQYPTIEQGLGNLTPDLWRRLMRALEVFESPDRDETSREDTDGGGGSETLFLAKITKAECIQPNIYKYAWEEVRLVEDYLDNEPLVVTFGGNKTSTDEGDEYAFAAVNVIELQNSSIFASAGVNMSSASYPSGYSLQAIGGGSCAGTGCEITPDIEAVVIMRQVSGDSTTGGEVVYLFSAVNDHDGACGARMITIEDPITGGDPVGATGKAHIWIDSSGDLKIAFDGGPTKTIITDD